MLRIIYENLIVQSGFLCGWKTGWKNTYVFTTKIQVLHVIVAFLHIMKVYLLLLPNFVIHVLGLKEYKK